MLFVTIEMRHQPFFGWIKDLSEKDPTSIFNLFGLIPWDPPSFMIIGALPVMMGFTMWLQPHCKTHHYGKSPNNHERWWIPWN